MKDNYLLRAEGLAMKIKIKIKKELDEISSSGAVAGYSAPLGSPEDVESFNKYAAKDQRLKGQRMDEMMSTSTGRGITRAYSVKDEEAAWQGHRERAKMQGNRAITEDDSLPSFLKNDFDLNTNDEPTEPVKKTIDDIIEEELIKNGLKPVKVKDKLKILGGGMFGGVYEAIQVDSDYLGAVKVIRAPEEDIDREIRNYVKVSKARSKDPLIEKHFPETFKTWKSVDEKGRPAGFIFMEKLDPVHPDAKQHLPDPSYWRTMKGQPTRLSKDIGQDISKRAEVYFKSDKFINGIKYELGRFHDDIDFDVEKAKKDIDLNSIELLDRLSNSDRGEDILSKSLSKARDLADGKKLNRAFQKLKFLMKEFKNSIFAKLVVLRVFNLFAKYGEDRVVKDAGLFFELDESLSYILKDLIDNTRTATITHGQYDKRKRLSPKQPGKKEGVEAAILALYDKTGLYARDLHWKNFMANGDGDLVVVDLGLFKMGREMRKVRESRQYRIKLLTKPKK